MRLSPEAERLFVAVAQCERARTKVQSGQSNIAPNGYSDRDFLRERFSELECAFEAFFERCGADNTQPSWRDAFEALARLSDENALLAWHAQRAALAA
jgi:hypothetical protein